MVKLLVYFLYGSAVIGSVYFFSKFIFYFLLRGFLPFIQSRPWVVDQIMAELDFKNNKPHIIALSSGRSGLLLALRKKYPQAVITGVQPKFFPFLVSQLQAWVRRLDIKILFRPLHHIDVSRADLVYSHLYPEEMENLGRKVKFECRPEAWVVSTGFHIPHLDATKEIELPDRPGKLAWLSKNQEIFKSKYKKFKKEKKAYFYQI